MLSTGRLLPMRVDEISQSATWTHCVAYCLLERETIDFTHGQLKSLGVHYQHEQQVTHRQKLHPNHNGAESCQLYGAKPQHFIYPGYFTKKLQQQYLQRRNSKKSYRKKKQQEKHEVEVENAKKSVFEVLSLLQLSQSKRRKEVTERQATCASQVIQEDHEGSKAEIEITVQRFQDPEEVRYSWVQERKGVAPFLVVVYWMGCRLLRALLP